MNTLLGYSYQDGGDVPSYQRSFGFGGGSSPTLSALLRKREKYKAQDEYEDVMREEAKKREKGSLWGGFGSLAGSLLLPALAGVSGGALLPLLAGLGGGLGKKMGASSGYSGKLDLNPFNAAKSEDYSNVMEDKDLIYGKKAFEDMDKSSRDYTRSGMEQDAIVSGLTSALMAGFGGDDSMYAKAGSTDLLKEGAGQRIKDLFKSQATTGLTERLTPEVQGKYALQKSLTDKVPTSFVSSFGSPEMQSIFSNAGLNAGRQPTFASNLMGANQDIYNPYKKYLMPNSDSLLGFTQ